MYFHQKCDQVNGDVIVVIFSFRRRREAKKEEEKMVVDLVLVLGLHLLSSKVGSILKKVISNAEVQCLVSGSVLVEHVLLRRHSQPVLALARRLTLWESFI